MSSYCLGQPRRVCQGIRFYFLRFRRNGRRFIYSPARLESDVQKSVLEEVVSKVFGVSRPALVRSLVSDEGLTDEELAELEVLIASMREVQR